MNLIALIAILSTLLILYIVGTIITSPFCAKDNDLCYDTFVSLVVGFLAVTTVYAIVKTGGNTIQWGVLILGASYVIKKNVEKGIHKVNMKFSIGSISIACVSGVIFFLYYAWFYYASPVNNIFHFDNYVYAYNSFSNQYNGIETTRIYLEGMAKATPYHYIEGWLCAMMANMFHINYLETFSVCVQCIFSAIVVMGLISLAKIYTDKLSIIIFACTTIFLSAILLDYSPIRQSMAMGGTIKDLVSAIFIIGFIISLLRKKTNYLWLLCLPISNVALTPVVMSALFLFAFVQFYVERNRGTLLYNLLTIIVLSIFIALFYFVQPNNFPKSSFNGNIVQTLLESYSINGFLYMTYRTLVSYSVYVPYFIPLLIVFAIRRDISSFLKSHTQLMLFLVISAFCGLLCHYMYYPIDNYDSGQLDILVNMTLMNLMVLISLLFVAQTIYHKVSMILFGIFLCSISIYNIWVFTESILSRRTIVAELRTFDYRKNILDYFAEHDISNVGARFLPPNSSGISFKNVGDIYQMGFLGGDKDGLAAINLSPINISEEQLHWNSIIPQSNIFNDYLSQFEQYNLDSVQLEFIKKYHLGFIICDSKVELPVGIESLIDTTFTDAKTGERFVFLKR